MSSSTPAPAPPPPGPARLRELQLCLAANAGDLEGVRRAVAEGVDVECQNDVSGAPGRAGWELASVNPFPASPQRRMTPLALSVTNCGAVAVTAFLIGAGADVNAAMDDLLLTPLHLACKDGNQTAIMLLLAAGADPLARDSMQRTALHYAVPACSVRVLYKLIKRSRGALVNAVDDAGYTALMVACEHSRLPAAQLLLDCGADARIRNKLNHHAVELADWFGAKKVRVRA